MPVNWNKQPLRDGLLLAVLFLCGVGLLAWSRPVSSAITQALTLCVQVLLPSLFPFFVVSALLVSSGAVQRLSPWLERPMRKLFGLPGSCGPALLLGAIGGYPVGARTVVSLCEQGLCSGTEGEKTLHFCNNAGPAFLISAIGTGLLQDAGLGLKLYGIHLLAALFIGIQNRKKSNSVKQFPCTGFSPQKNALIPQFLQAVSGSFASFLNVCAFVLLFAVLMCLLQQTPLLSLLSAVLPGGGALWNGLLSGFLELTSGAALLARSGLPRKLLLPALSFLCGWGGLSVQFQTISLLQEAELPCRSYLKAKLAQGLLAALLTLFLCL